MPNKKNYIKRRVSVKANFGVFFYAKIKEDNMKIGKEKEVEIKIHKKQDGKIHKKKDVKKDNKTMSTRTKNNARAMRKVA